MARAMAIEPRIADTAMPAGVPLLKMRAAAVKAPKTVTPERAFIPDIRGVWRRVGTLDMSLYPTTVATANTPRRIN